MKGHWSRVNLVNREARLKDLHATSALSFPSANKKCVLQSLIIYLQMTLYTFRTIKTVTVLNQFNLQTHLISSGIFFSDSVNHSFYGHFIC